MILYPEHSKGSISELEAAQYFLSKGHQVFLPLVRQGIVDMIVQEIENEIIYRVQVKTASWNRVDTYEYLQCRTLSTNKNRRHPEDRDYDLLVVVYEKEIWVIPAHQISSSNITLRDHSKGRKWDKFKVTH